MTEHHNNSSIEYQLIERDRLENVIRETNIKFQQLLQAGQYYAAIILFKSLLHEKDTWSRSTNPNYFVQPHHLQWIYYTAIAYFNLGDYDHAVAMLNIILRLDPNNVRILIMLTQALINQGLWKEASNSIIKFNNLQVNMAEKAEIDNMVKLIGAHINNSND